MKVEIWSDVVCPWCALGRRRFAAALARFPHAAEVVVRYRSFELDPGAPRRYEGDREQRLAAKFGSDRAQVRAMHDRMAAMGAEEGVEFRFEAAQDGSTVDAHRLLHLAWEAGGATLQETLKERLQHAYFAEGEPIGEPEALRRLAVDAGLEAGAVDRVLGSDEYLDAVRADEDRARRHGITGVPFFVVDATYGASGAQPADALLRLLEKAWEEGDAARSA